MTFLKSKSDEAGQLLIQLRKNHYCFVIADNLPDIEEFITYFYNNLLQTKKWHIARNNRWRVINFYLKADTYAESIELLLQKDHFSDRKVNLAFESDTIKLLKSGKTSLNKLYKSYQNAYNYNYMFCVFPNLNQSEEDLLQMIREIQEIFIQSSIQKTEPLYTLIGLTTQQKSLIDNHGDYLDHLSLNDDNTWHLPGITKEEINHILSEYAIFNNAQPNIRENIILEIQQSNDTLLHLKNTTRKLKIGILPTTENTITELKINKGGMPKISIKPLEENTIEKQNQELSNKTAPLNKKNDIDPEQLYRSLSTKYQMNNALKIMMMLFQMTEDMQVQHQSIGLTMLSSRIDVPVKEIRKSLSPFVAKKIFFVDDEDDHTEIEVLQHQVMYAWERLRTILQNKAAYTELFKDLFDLEDNDIQLKHYALNMSEAQWDLLKNEEKTFWVHFLIAQKDNIQQLEYKCEQILTFFPDNDTVTEPTDSPQISHNDATLSVQNKNPVKIAIKSKNESEHIEPEPKVTESKQIKINTGERIEQNDEATNKVANTLSEAPNELMPDVHNLREENAETDVYQTPPEEPLDDVAVKETNETLKTKNIIQKNKTTENVDATQEASSDAIDETRENITVETTATIEDTDASEIITPPETTDKESQETISNNALTGHTKEGENAGETAEVAKKIPLKINPIKMNPEKPDDSDNFNPHRTKLTFKKKD